MPKIVIDCMYNKGVGCSETPSCLTCGKCGWNPDVERVRKERIWATLKILDPDLEIPEHWLLGDGPYPE